VYFRPGDVQDLRRAIERALTMEASEGLRERILERFTWDEAARKTLEGYRLALATAHAADQCQQAPKAGQ
jgi:glycosyltransferase involved in cell wall biosynthesis